MWLKGLAEGIIIQSLEDLWIDKERDESVEFFNGEGFSICAEVAGMDLHDQVRLFNLVNNILEHNKINTAARKNVSRRYHAVHI